MSMAGRMVREARRRGKLTQRELAKRAGIPQETIARIERGRADPRVNTLDRLLAACEMGLDVVPRLGIGIDRTQIHDFLEMTPEARLRWAIDVDEHYVELRRSFRVAQ